MSLSGPVGIRTRVRSSGGPYAIQAILRAQNEKEKVFAGVRYSPAILCLLLRGRRRMKNLPFSVLCGELGVSAASAGHTVLVDCHECSGSAFGTELLGPGDGVSVDLVCAGLFDCCLGCCCFCHQNHSSAAGASGAFASMPFLFRRYSLSNSRAASFDS